MSRRNGLGKRMHSPAVNVGSDNERDKYTRLMPGLRGREARPATPRVERPRKYVEWLFVVHRPHPWEPPVAPITRRRSGYHAPRRPRE